MACPAHNDVQYGMGGWLAREVLLSGGGAGSTAQDFRWTDKSISLDCSRLARQAGTCTSYVTPASPGVQLSQLPEDCPTACAPQSCPSE